MPPGPPLPWGSSPVSGPQDLGSRTGGPHHHRCFLVLLSLLLEPFRCFWKTLRTSGPLLWWSSPEVHRSGAASSEPSSRVSTSWFPSGPHNGLNPQRPGLPAHGVPGHRPHGHRPHEHKPHGHSVGSHRPQGDGVEVHSVRVYRLQGHRALPSPAPPSTPSQQCFFTSNSSRTPCHPGCLGCLHQALSRAARG